MKGIPIITQHVSSHVGTCARFLNILTRSDDVLLVASGLVTPGLDVINSLVSVVSGNVLLGNITLDRSVGSISVGKRSVGIILVGEKSLGIISVGKRSRGKTSSNPLMSKINFADVGTLVEKPTMQRREAIYKAIASHSLHFIARTNFAHQ